MKLANEIDAISDLSCNLEKILVDEFTPDSVRHQASLLQKMIEVRPLQQSLREQILANYFANQQLYYKVLAKSRGDRLYEH